MLTSVSAQAVIRVSCLAVWLAMAGRGVAARLDAALVAQLGRRERRTLAHDEELQETTAAFRELELLRRRAMSTAAALQLERTLTWPRLLESAWISVLDDDDLGQAVLQFQLRRNAAWLPHERLTPFLARERGGLTAAIQQPGRGDTPAVLPPRHALALTAASSAK